jgi:diaminopimelate decarboxylase
LQEFREPLENRDGKLFFDGVSVEDLASKFDTPLYVISEKRIRANYRRVKEAFVRNYEKTRVFYAAKANTNLSVLKILESEGAYLDAVSPGEVSLALMAGFPPERILFTGTSVRDDELKFMVDSKIAVNNDSLSELDRLLALEIPDLVSVRVNPEIGAGHHDHCITAGRNAKFGLWEDDAVKAFVKAKSAGVNRFGLHMHVGSGILDIEPLVLALDKLLSIAKKIHDQAEVEFEFIDMGGGL